MMEANSVAWIGMITYSVAAPGEVNPETTTRAFVVAAEPATFCI